MKSINQPLSIKVIFWITNIFFWLFSIAAIIASVFAFLIISGLIHDIELSIGVPVAVDILEKGTLDLSFMPNYVDIEFKEMYGQLHIVNTPIEIARIYGVFMLLMIVFTFYIFRELRLFVLNIYRGKYFDFQTISRLKRISYGIVVIWIFTAFYAWFQYFFLIRNADFSGLNLTSNVETYPGLLFVAVFIWALSHIFSKGLQLQEENKLTI